MAYSEVFDLRRRALEADYVRRQDQALIKRIQQRISLEQARTRLAEATKITDVRVLDDLLAAGFTSETAQLIYLAPLVQMAWAEGEVSDAERQVVFAAARGRDIEEGSVAHDQLSEWLKDQPLAEQFERWLATLGKVLCAMVYAERAMWRQTIVGGSMQVALASGGVMSAFGVGSRVVVEESHTLKRIINALEVTAHAA